MLPPEVLTKIQNLHFRTKYLANDLFAGQYESAFKGHGIEFAEVREYQEGDDIRTIDWNVSARLDNLFVKVFHQERSLNLMLVLDISGSHLFGTNKRFKRELMAEVAGMLAFLAIKTNDKVGAILFSSKVEKFLPPQKGSTHVWRLIKEIFTFEPTDRATDIDAALSYLNNVVKRHSIVFLISDCIDTGFERSLRITSKKHELTVIRIFDPAEDELPEAGFMTFKDPETGKIALINTRSKDLKAKWHFERENQKTYLEELVRRSGADLVNLATNGPVVEPLVRLFDQRKGRA